jgi:hypothetical protein
MADHVRKQIRAALTTALTGLATASTLYVGRVAPIDADNLPALVLATDAENVERGSKGGGQARTLTAEIAGHAQQTSGILDTFDAIAKEVEAAIAAAAALAAIAKSVDLIGTEIELSGEAAQPAGLVRLTYAIVYHTNEAAPDVAL